MKKTQRRVALLVLCSLVVQQANCAVPVLITQILSNPLVQKGIELAAKAGEALIALVEAKQTADVVAVGVIGAGAVANQLSNNSTNPSSTPSTLPTPTSQQTQRSPLAVLKPTAPAASATPQAKPISTTPTPTTVTPNTSTPTTSPTTPPKIAVTTTDVSTKPLATPQRTTVTATQPSTKVDTVAPPRAATEAATLTVPKVETSTPTLKPLEAPKPEVVVAPPTSPKIENTATPRPQEKWGRIKRFFGGEYRDANYVPADKTTGASIDVKTEVRTPTNDQIRSASYAQRRQYIDEIRNRGEYDRAANLDSQLHADITASWSPQPQAAPKPAPIRTVPENVKPLVAPTPAPAPSQPTPAQPAVTPKVTLQLEPTRLPVPIPEIPPNPNPRPKISPTPQPMPRPMPQQHREDIKLPNPPTLPATRNLQILESLLRKKSEDLTEEERDKLAILQAAGDRINAGIHPKARELIDKTKAHNKASQGGRQGMQQPDPDDEKDKNKNKIEWTPHGGKHIPKKQPWDQTINETRYDGNAKYRWRNLQKIEEIERKAWEKGTPTNDSKQHKVMLFDEIIGANNGQETQCTLVESTNNGRVIHGHPITMAEYLSKIKKI